MKKAKATNGYTVYEATERDVEKYGFEAGRFYVFFSSDIRDYGIENSYPEFEGLDTLEEALAYCCGNYAKAREIVESRTTCATFEEIAEVEAQLDAGKQFEDGELIEEDAEPEEEAADDQSTEPAAAPAGIQTVRAELIPKSRRQQLGAELLKEAAEAFELPEIRKEFESWKRRKEAAT